MGAGDRVGDRREGLESLAFVFKPVVDDQHPDLPAPCTLDEASSPEVASAGPRQVATVRPTLQVSVGSFRVGCHADFGIDRQLSRSGPSSLRKVTFGVGLEAPGDSPDPISVRFG